MRSLMPAPQPFQEPAPSVAMGETVDLPDPTRAAADFVQAQQALGASWGEAVGMAAAIHGVEAARPLWAIKGHGAPGTRDARDYAMDMLELLDDVSKSSPTAANAWLGEALTQGHLSVWTNHASGDQGFFFRDKSWITALPDDLKVNGDLHLKDCPSLLSLPEGLRVQGDLILEDCTSLASLPDGLQVEGDLSLRGCASLQMLPEHLNVGLLDLGNCTALRHLPSGLDVRYWLHLCGCSAWDGKVPQDAKVGDSIYTDQHLTGVNLATWRRLHPEGELCDGNGGKGSGA